MVPQRKDTCLSAPEELRCSPCKATAVSWADRSWAAAAASASSAGLVTAWQQSLPELIFQFALPWRLNKKHRQAVHKMAAGLSALALPSLCLFITEPHGRAHPLGLLPATAHQAFFASKQQQGCRLQSNCWSLLASLCNHSTCLVFLNTDEAAAGTFWLEKLWWKTKLVTEYSHLVSITTALC